MDWIDEQIRLRKKNDSELFEDSILGMTSVVLGKRVSDALRDKRFVTKAAIDDILKYYHCKPVEIPSAITDPEEQLDYALRPYGIMRRDVILSENWYKDTFAPMLGIRKDDGMPVPLLRVAKLPALKSLKNGVGRLMSRDIIAASSGSAALNWMRFMASSREAVKRWEDTRMQNIKTAVLQRIIGLPLSSTKLLKNFVARGRIMPTSVTMSVSAKTAV